ncbi:hypothetical protein BX661DRAFT_177507 [Kickxella alabastrina]|uniref:uncharacterized protein n=1 Tax=Kickxella alabastrina TaxID=61397 RepID=UPI0022200CED|nr:uncharacterized protein BX661DRAFT_177507 [Kickxella alabastrina]KAI7833770.1 hypothetical protein BX661DRAFT_177507 [Kickxella alabastrina]
MIVVAVAVSVVGSVVIVMVAEIVAVSVVTIALFVVVALVAVARLVCLISSLARLLTLSMFLSTEHKKKERKI